MRAALTPDQMRRAAGVIIREIVWLHRQAERVEMIPATDATDRTDIAARAAEIRATRDAMLAVLPLVDAAAGDLLYAKISESSRQHTSEVPEIGLRDFAGASVANTEPVQMAGGA